MGMILPNVIEPLEIVYERVNRMSDLISRQDAINVADAVWSVTGDKNVAKVWDQIKDLPSAEPERKKGKWIDAVLPNDSGGLQVQVCDQCNTFFPLAYTGGGHNFCPNCGADMREEEQDG